MAVAIDKLVRVSDKPKETEAAGREPGKEAASADADGAERDAAARSPTPVGGYIRGPVDFYRSHEPRPAEAPGLEAFGLEEGKLLRLMVHPQVGLLNQHEAEMLGAQSSK